jgi:hypothetical protein
MLGWKGDHGGKGSNFVINQISKSYYFLSWEITLYMCEQKQI